MIATLKLKKNMEMNGGGPKTNQYAKLTHLFKIYIIFLTINDSKVERRIIYFIHSYKKNGNIGIYIIKKRAFKVSFLLHLINQNDHQQKKPLQRQEEENNESMKQNLSCY